MLNFCQLDKPGFRGEIPGSFPKRTTEAGKRVDKLSGGSGLDDALVSLAHVNDFNDQSLVLRRRIRRNALNGRDDLLSSCS